MPQLFQAARALGQRHARPLRALATAVWLHAACVALHAAEAPAAVAVDASFDAAAVAAAGFQITDTKALKGLTRVAVPVFVVDFVIGDNVRTQTSGFGSAGRASSALSYKLLGVGEAEFQALTDAMHAGLLQRLKDSGLQVLGADEMQAAPAYRKLADGGKKMPMKSDTNLVMSAQGVNVYGFARGGTGAAKTSAGVFGAIASLGTSFSAVGDVVDSIALARELNAATLELRLRVNFVELTDNNKGFFGRLSNTASTTGRAFPSIDGVTLHVQQGDWRSVLTLGPALVLDPAVFATVREKPTTAGDVAGTVLAGLINLASGSKDRSSSTEMEAIADPARYAEIVGAGLHKVSDLLVQRLKAER